MIVDLEYVYVPYPHLEYFDVGAPVSAMTTLFVWGEPSIYGWVQNAKKNYIDTDYLICAPNLKDASSLKVFQIIENSRVIKRNYSGDRDRWYDTPHPPIGELPKLEGDIYKKMVLIKRSEEDQLLYSITEGKKIVITDFTGPYDQELIVHAV